MEELEKPSKFDVMLLSGRVGVSFVIRGAGCFAGGYVTSNLLSLNVVGKWAITLTIAAYAFWFTGRPYSQTNVCNRG